MLLVIAGAFLFWSTYNPTVTDLVYITITPSQSRILSGEYVTYTITYKNNSPVRLTNASLILELPEGFILDKAEPSDFDQAESTLTLDSVEPKEEGIISLSGWFYGTPALEDHIEVQLSYKQDGKKHTETKTSPHIAFLRGSVLEMKADVREQVIEGARVPVSLMLTNNGDEVLRDISFSLKQFAELGTLEDLEATKGLVDQISWTFGELRPEESVKFTGTLHIGEFLSEDSYTLGLAPTLMVRGKTITQTTVQKHITVARPDARVQATWDEGTSSLKPGEMGRLTVRIVNNGTITLDTGVLEVPLPGSVVNMRESARINGGTLSGSTLVMKKNSNLQTIPPGESRVVVVLLPISSAPDGGTDILLRPTVRFKGHISIAPDVVIDRVATAGALKVGTQVTLSGEVRYYTAEGDQLGRGPLPPVVGKETKYAALFTIRNTTSNVGQTVFTAKLPSHAVWTGKTSVTQGTAPTYSASTRTVKWNVGTIAPHATAGIFFELSLTPVESQINTTPSMVINADISGTDTYLGYTLNRSLSSLDTSLVTDPIGKAKGVMVR